MVGHVERRREAHVDLVLRRADLVVAYSIGIPTDSSARIVSLRSSVAASIVVIAK